MASDAPLLCRGPTVQDVRAVVGDVHRTIVESSVGSTSAVADGGGGGGTIGDEAPRIG